MTKLRMATGESVGKNKGKENEWKAFMREGEMLALAMEDIDLVNKQIHITKTYYRANKKDIITEPKTDNSVRTIEIPDFLTKEIEDYWQRLYQYPKDERSLYHWRWWLPAEALFRFDRKGKCNCHFRYLCKCKGI